MGRCGDRDDGDCSVNDFVDKVFQILDRKIDVQAHFDVVYEFVPQCDSPRIVEVEWRVRYRETPPTTGGACDTSTERRVDLYPDIGWRRDELPEAFYDRRPRRIELRNRSGSRTLFRF